MSTEPQELYIKRNPGDLVTADDWNDVQRKIKDDINQQVTTAIGKIQQVPEAVNALKLQGQSAGELSASILEQARQELPKRSGYQRIFKRLQPGDENVVEHKLGGCPLVDIYQLDRFDVVSSEDDVKEQLSVYFFLYHSSERRLKLAAGGASVEIEPTGGTPFRIAFADMLAYYQVQYTDSTTLEEVETKFWEAFLVAPNDDFSDDYYTHSPWFDRECGERRTVGELKSRGDWNQLWFKVQPRKTINMQGAGKPPSLEVYHFDFNKLGIKYTPQPSITPQPSPTPSPVFKPSGIVVETAAGEVESASVRITSEDVVTSPPVTEPISLMVLLKV